MSKSIAQNLSDTLTILLFCGLIAVPVVGTAFHWDFYSRQDENRVFADKPVFAESGLAGYPDAFEAYYDDHFGFRNTFIRRYRKLWPKISGKENQRVLAGKGKWLFYLSEGVISDFIGANPFSERDLEAWQRSIEERTEWLAERDCRYLFALAPNKPRIYPENLPEETRVLEKEGRAPQLVDHMAEHSEAQVLYLREAVRKGKSAGEVYFPNDTHWNDLGSVVAHKAIVDYLGEAFDLSGLEPVATEALVFTPEPRIGDLAGMTLNPAEYELPRNAMRLRDPAPIEERAFKLPPQDPDGERHILAHLPPVTKINPKGKHRAVVFHDSFGEFGLFYLLPQVFAETTFFYCYSDPEILAEAVEQLKPDVVIELLVERHLQQKVDEDEPRFERFFGR